jgi:hypothetical protein
MGLAGHTQILCRAASPKECSGDFQCTFVLHSSCLVRHARAQRARNASFTFGRRDGLTCHNRIRCLVRDLQLCFSVSLARTEPNITLPECGHPVCSGIFFFFCWWSTSRHLEFKQSATYCRLVFGRFSKPPYQQPACWFLIESSNRNCSKFVGNL